MMQVRWTDSAVHDLTAICDYIEKQGSAATARRVALIIHERLNLAAQFPESGRTGRAPDTRELVFTGLPYLAIYRTYRESIQVLRILHGAQVWP